MKKDKLNSVAIQIAINRQNKSMQDNALYTISTVTCSLIKDVAICLVSNEHHSIEL